MRLLQLKNRNIKKKAARGLVLVMTAGLLAGCSCAGKKVYFTTGLGEDEVFKIEGSACKDYTAKILLTTEKNTFEKSYGSQIWSQTINGVTFEQYVKDNVKNELAQMKSMNLLAKDQDIELSGDEEAYADYVADSYFNKLSDADRAYLDVTLEEVEKVYEQYYLARKVYSELPKDVNPEISDAQAKIIKVQSIYAKTYVLDANGNRTDFSEEEKANAKAKLEKLIEQINGGADFREVALNNTDASQVEYQFGRGEMVAEFENAAFALSAGQVSGVIESADGYYVIKCISDYMETETAKHKSEMVQEEKDKAFLAVYDPFVEKLSSEFNDSLWNSISFDKMTGVTVDNFYTITGDYASYGNNGNEEQKESES